MKQYFLLILLIGLIAPTGLHAQKVYNDGSKTILDLTENAGMPAGAITDVSKYTSFTPSETVLDSQNDQNGSINATVFQKLEIAPSDLDQSGTIGSTAGTFTWIEAFNSCKSLNYNGTGWRLPTQRELILIHIFKPALDDINGITFNEYASYWSATEYGAGSSWCITFFGSNLREMPKSTTTCYARCVREVTD